MRSSPSEKIILYALPRPQANYLKEFLSKLNALDNSSNAEQLKELEIILNTAEADNIDSKSSKPSVSIQIMQEAIAALKGQESNGRRITKKSVQEVQAEILKKLEEHRESLIKITNRSLSSTGVVIEDKRGRESVVRLFLSYNPDSKDEAVRFQTEMQSLKLTSAQINYLKMSLNQENFPGTISSIIPYIDEDKRAVTVMERQSVTMKIIVEGENKVFLELSRISLLQDAYYDVRGALFHKSRIDISNIEEDRVMIGAESFTFPLKAPLPQPIAGVIAVGCALKNLSSVKDTTKSQQENLKIVQGITNDCGIHALQKYAIEHKPGGYSSIKPLEKLQNMQESLRTLYTSRNAKERHHETLPIDINDILSALIFTDKIAHSEPTVMSSYSKQSNFYESFLSSVSTVPIQETHNSVSTEKEQIYAESATDQPNLLHSFLKSMIIYIKQLVDAILHKTSAYVNHLKITRGKEHSRS